MIDGKNWDGLVKHMSSLTGFCSIWQACCLQLYSRTPISSSIKWGRKTLSVQRENAVEELWRSPSRKRKWLTQLEKNSADAWNVFPTWWTSLCFPGVKGGKIGGRNIHQLWKFYFSWSKRKSVRNKVLYTHDGLLPNCSPLICDGYRSGNRPSLEFNFTQFQRQFVHAL